MTESTQIPLPKKELVKPSNYKNYVGWHKDIPNDEYHGGPGTSSSNIKTFLKKTGAHYHYDKTHYTHKATDTMDLGTAFHTLTLEPHKFDEDIVVRPASIKTRKGPAWESFKLDAGNRTIITEAQYSSAKKMADKVKCHDYAGPLVESLIVESSIYWWYNEQPDVYDFKDNLIDDNKNVLIDQKPDGSHVIKELMKCRPDGLSPIYPIAIDLKSAASASFTGFMKAIVDYFYHVSAAMYMEGINQCDELLEELGHIAITKFVYIVCENTPPYEVALYELSEKDRNFGSMLYHRSVRKLHEARQADWPGYINEQGIPAVRETELPPWAERGDIV